MELREIGYRMLVVSRPSRFTDQVCNILEEDKHVAIHREFSASAARMCLSQMRFDLVFVCDPLTDESAVNLAMELSSDSSTVVSLIVQAEKYDDVFYQASQNGVYVLSRPIPRQLLLQSIDWMASTRERLRRLEKKSTSLEGRMKEIKTVNRAKWVLISKRGMSEEEAHRYIEKSAMDSGRTRLAVSEQIISEYGE